MTEIARELVAGGADVNIGGKDRQQAHCGNALI
jgi:hypothetical protein